MTEYRSEETTKILRPMIVFHNLVKEHEVYGKLVNAQHILEFGAGHLNDLMRWSRQGIKKVTAVEIDQKSIDRGLEFYKILRQKHQNLPEVVYIQADLAKDDIRSKISPGDYDGIVSNFSFHYFLRDRDSFKNIMQIIQHAAKPTGCKLFITGLNGSQVRQMLENLPSRGSETPRREFRMRDGQLAAYISRHFDPSSPRRVFGDKIAVFLASIGIEHPEYLMYDDLLVREMKNKKIQLKYVKTFGEFMPLYLNRKLDRALYQYSRLNMLMCFKIS